MNLTGPGSRLDQSVCWMGLESAINRSNQRVIIVVSGAVASGNIQLTRRVGAQR